MVIYGGSGFFDIFALQQIWLYVSPYRIAHLLFSHSGLLHCHCLPAHESAGFCRRWIFACRMYMLYCLCLSQVHDFLQRLLPQEILLLWLLLLFSFSCKQVLPYLTSLFIFFIFFMPRPHDGIRCWERRGIVRVGCGVRQVKLCSKFIQKKIHKSI